MTVRELRDAFARLPKATAPILEEIRRNLSALDLEELKRDLETLPQTGPEFKERVGGFLIERGWFIYYKLSFGEAMAIARLIRDGRYDDVDDFVLKISHGVSENTLDLLVECFPNREPILRQAFEAHNNRQYAVSIPTMLAQWDGIFLDLCGTNFFRRNSEYNRVCTKLKNRYGLNTEKALKFTLEMYLEPFFEAEFLKESNKVWKQRLNSSSYRPLNRNVILHGNDTQYPTEANSYRVIQMLAFLALIYSEIEQLRED